MTAGHAGIVDQDSNTAKCGQRFRDKRLPVFFAGDVEPLEARVFADLCRKSSTFRFQYIC